jgi:hypothetical protein
MQHDPMGDRAGPYPRFDTPKLTNDDVAEDLQKARDIVTAMGRLVLHLEPW